MHAQDAAPVEDEEAFLPATEQVPIDNVPRVMSLDGVPDPLSAPPSGEPPVVVPPVEGAAEGPLMSDVDAFQVPPDPEAVSATSVQTVMVDSGLVPVDVARTVRIGRGPGRPRARNPFHVRARVLSSTQAAAVGLAGGAVVLLPGRNGSMLDIEFDAARLVASSTADVLSRVQVVALPACALTTPDAAGCSTRSKVAFKVEADREVVRAWTSEPLTVMSTSATTVLGAAPKGGGGVVVGLATTTNSSTTDYTATPLNASASWAVGEQAGNFSWSYPIPVPPAWYGGAPAVSLSYSSQSLDGLSDIENNQGGLLGLGWDVSAGGFIERSYRPCSQDGGSAADLCWISDNATISLNGKSSRLVPTGTSDEWRLEQDPNWIVRRLTNGTAPGNADNDKERWEVWAADGTVYRFGTAPNTTNSVWTVPVRGNHPGEPCYQTGTVAPACTQAWRWNLDQIVDSSGNLTTFTYVRQTNRYLLGGGTLTTYDRGGYLSTIEYGRRSGSAGGPTRLWFETAKRCAAADLAASGCAWLDASRTSPYWPDRPSDLLCPSANNCPTAPTFFIDDVLSAVYAQQRSNPTTAPWVNVDRIQVTTELLPTATGQAPQIWLRQLDRTGAWTGSDAGTVPPVVISGILLDNRGDSLTIPYWRASSIEDELGGVTEVTYRTQQTACPVANWHQNSTLCFPLYTRVNSNGSSGDGTFYKYVTAQVVQRDATTASTVPLVTSYDYLDGPGWRQSDDVATWANWRRRSDFRGFSRVRISAGVPGEKVTTEKIFMLGMNGDPMPSPQPPRAGLTIATTGGLMNDDPWTRGFLVESRTLDAGSGAKLSYALSRYSFEPTVTTNGVVLARRAQEIESYTGVVTQGGVWRETAVHTSYTADGFVQQVIEFGDAHVGGDERCTYTSYLAATSTLRGLPNGQQRFAGSTCSGPVQGFTQWFYDNATSATAAPTRGLMTRVRSFHNASEFIDIVTEYDTFGRVTRTINGNGAPTTTAYNAFPGNPTKVTNPAGHVITTTLDTGRGLPTKIVDANGNTTNLAYDSLGRLLRVSRPGDAQPTIVYEYSVTKSAPPFVKTTITQDTSTTPTSWQYFDGLGRPRETQVPSPTGVGRIVTAIDYDSKGLTTRTTQPFHQPGAAGWGMVTANGWLNAPNETRTGYDAFNRPTYTATVATGAELWRTSIVRDGWLTSTIPPTGGPTMIEQDAYGRTITETRYGDPVPPNSYTYAWVTRHTYSVRGELTSTTDPAGNVTVWNYDWLGRRKDELDRDRGLTSYTYDNNSNPTTMTPATGLTETYFYDVLDRLTSVWVGGFKRREMFFDATGELGLLNRSVAYNYTGTTPYPYTIDVTGYDKRNRPKGTTYTIPAQPGVTDGLNGTYTFAQTYNAADLVNSVTYPPVADLAVGGSETVNTTFWPTGQPRQLGGWEWYVHDTSYNYDGTLLNRIMGPPDANNLPSPLQIVRGFEYQQSTGRLVGLTAARRSGQVLQADRYWYDPVGNIGAISHNPDGTASDHTECFGYDARNRLTRAFTTSVIDNCAGGPNALGPNPYDHTMSVSSVGNITTGPAGNYTYNPSGAGSIRPHAPTAVGSTTFDYDAAGRRKSSTTSGVQTTYNWNVPGDLLATVNRGGSTIESNVYGPDGQRLLRSTAGGTTLYLGGLTEITRTASGTTTAKRFYQTGGVTVAVRTYTDVRVMIGNHQGSTSATASVYNADVDYQTYQPYGTKRGGDTIPVTDRGFLGQTEDDATGLVYLNNRYHDPTLGTFISVDPLVSATGEPYIYASGNPTTLSDPTGLAACEDDGNCPWSTGNCTRLCGPGHLNDEQRSTISSNPDRFSQVLQDCWYQGASGCEGMRERMGSEDGLLDAAQLILLGFAQQGGFQIDGEFLMSPYYSNSQNVNFVTDIGPGGEVVVSLVHAPSATFKEMAAGGLQVVGTAMSVIAIGGLIACAETGGGGCAVSSLAGGLSAAVSGVSASIVCSDGASTSCAWSAGSAVASIATFGVGAGVQGYLKSAGLFQGGIAQAYRVGSVYTSIGASMFDIAGYGMVEQHDEVTGVHMYGVVL